MVDALIKHLIARIDVGGISLIIISIGAIYIWYQHNSNKLLKEEIELERKKRKEFLDTNISEIFNKQSTELSFKLPNNVLDILCVDDEELVRNLVKEALHNPEASIRIDTASDGKEAFEKCIKHPPTILITDIVMPRMNGIDLINLLRGKYKNIPVIIISGYASSGDLEAHGIKLNDNTIFLRKPFRPEELISILKKLADKLNGGV